MAYLAFLAYRALPADENRKLRRQPVGGIHFPRFVRNVCKRCKSPLAGGRPWAFAPFAYGKSGSATEQYRSSAAADCPFCRRDIHACFKNGGAVWRAFWPSGIRMESPRDQVPSFLDPPRRASLGPIRRSFRARSALTICRGTGGKLGVPRRTRIGKFG